MERNVNDVTGIIVNAAYKLHSQLGPGLLESVYETILARALERQGLHVAQQHVVSFEYEGILFDQGLRVDLLVNHCDIVELKSVEQLAPIHSKQLLTYLRLLRLPVGLLINFGAPTMKAGLRRVVNNYQPPQESAAE